IRGVGHDVEQFAPVIGEDGVDALKRMGFEAVEIVRQRIERYGIDCDLTWGYCDLATKPRHLQNFEEELADLQRLGYPHPLRQLNQNEMGEVIGSDRYQGGLLDLGSGHLHPLNLALGEAAAAQSLGVRLYEHSAAERIDYGAEIRVHTATGRVRARQLVLACNAYLGQLHPQLAGKVLPAGSYIIATEPLPESLC